MQRNVQRVIVASENPVKVNAAREAFAVMFPDEEFSVEGVAVDSGVNDQPQTDEETFAGAMNRLSRVREAAPEVDFWVGIEGGIEDKDGETEVFAWIVVESREGKFGKGRTGTFFLPPKLTKLVREGKELKVADDMVFARADSGRTNGTVGILTGDIIDRTHYYVHALVLALVPFRNPDLYS